MEYGQQMKQAKDNAMMAFYQNPGYQLERRNKKTFILKVDSDGTINFNKPLHEPLIIDRLSDIYLESFLTWHQKIDGKPVRTNNGATPAINTINFSSTTVNANTDIEGVEGDDDGLSPPGNTTVSPGADADLINTSAFVLNINEFNNQGNSSLNDNDTKLFNKIVIPHVIPTSGESGEYRKIHKSRKLNYICSMNPTTLSRLSGTITGLDGTKQMFTRTGDGPFVSDMFLAEFVIVARD